MSLRGNISAIMICLCKVTGVVLVGLSILATAAAAQIPNSKELDRYVQIGQKALAVGGKPEAEAAFEKLRGL